jgi:Neutral/alkaline non-lysosomal ceramidase, N-terminal
MTTLTAGAARIKLKPPPGIAMIGYGGRTGKASAVHDDLAAQAMVIGDGRRKLALCGVDVLAIGMRIADDVCERVAAQSDIAADAIIIAATHTHSGPIFNIFATPKADAPAASDRDLEWERALPGKIASAILEADRNREAAHIRVASARFTLGTNRRLPTPTGEIRLAAHYGGVADPEVKALAAYRADGSTIAFVMNYACHGVVLCEDNLLYSRDYAGFAQDEIEHLGASAGRNTRPAESSPVAIFLNGATGNIDPRVRGNFEVAEEWGRAMGRAAFEALANTHDLTDARIASHRVPLALRLKDLDAAIAAARAYIEQTSLSLKNHRGGDHQLRRLKAEHERARNALQTIEMLDSMNRRDRRVNMEKRELATRLALARIGDVAIVGLPGEAFVEFGLALKANPYFPHTFVIGYCNDLIGYIPTREAYPQGGYEVDSARVAQGTGEQIVAAALAGLSELRGGTLAAA